MRRMSRRVAAVAAAGIVLALLPAPATAAGRVDDALKTPPAEKIPAAPLKAAIEQAVACGVASLKARITADGNSFGLAFPPRVSRKQIGTKDMPASRKVFTEPVYEREYATVDQLVPETSGGQPTGRFVKSKVKVVVKVTKVGEKQVERLVHDPNGSLSYKVPVYGPGGPDVYEPGLPAYNGMALYALAKSGCGKDLATERLALALSDLIEKFGISDHTYDVAWMTAGFCALGSDSPHADLARTLAARLVDGQIREKGEARGLWGPVCINYAYFSRLFDMQQALRQEVEVRLPQIIESAPPQQQAAIVKQGKEVRKVYVDVQRAGKRAASLGMRLMDVKKPCRDVEEAIIPGLPLFIYNRVVADVESTAAAAFALAEARRAGLLPAETDRPKIRNKKVHVAEKTDPSLELAIDRLVAGMAADGGFPSLTVQAVNTGFDKSTLIVAGVPFKGQHPALVQVETAETNLSGQTALEFLALAAPEAAKGRDEPRERSRARAAAIAERWYRHSVGGFYRDWDDVYAKFTTPLTTFKESPQVPQPPLEPFAVDKLPWGGMAAGSQIVPVLMGLFAAKTPAEVIEDDLFRQIAYRIVSLQDDDGQWIGRLDLPPSSGVAALAIEEGGNRYFRAIEANREKLPEKLTYRGMLRPTWGVGADVVYDRNAFATLASLAFLLQAVDAPVDLGGVPILPEEQAAADGAEAGPMTSIQAATGAKRPNAARAALFDAILGVQKIDVAEVSAAAPAAAAATMEPAAEEPAEDLGTVEDLLKPAAE